MSFYKWRNWILENKCGVCAQHPNFCRRKKKWDCFASNPMRNICQWQLIWEIASYDWISLKAWRSEFWTTWVYTKPSQYYIIFMIIQINTIKHLFLRHISHWTFQVGYLSQSLSFNNHLYLKYRREAQRV